MIEWLFLIGKIFAGFCISLVGGAAGLALCYFIMKKTGMGEQEIGAGLGYMLGFGTGGFIIAAILSYFAMR